VAGADDLPVIDHHCHLSPTGEGIGAAVRFRASGGTHLFLCTQNYESSPPCTLDGYRTQFDTTLALADRVRTECGVVVSPVLAPYPIDIAHVAAEIGLPAAVQLHRAALDLAGEFVREHRAVALGEVGWAHFSVEPEVDAAIQSAFDYAFSVARDVGCPLVVHGPQLDPVGWAQLAERAREAGVPEARVIKHYTRLRLPEADRHGVVPSYLARSETFRAALSDRGPWFLETDFLDDPRRPGAVLDLTTVPRRVQQLRRGRPDLVDRLWIPFVESVERVYGWRPSAGEAKDW
jgi:TatD-related deoxyribonuclease